MAEVKREEAENGVAVDEGMLMFMFKVDSVLLLVGGQENDENDDDTRLQTVCFEDDVKSDIAI